MATADVTITYADVAFPASSAPVVNHVNVQIGVQTQTVQPGVTDVVFNGLAAGDYTAVAQAFDGNGQPIGNPVTQAFSIPAGPPATVNVSLPASLSVAVSQ
jgi:hypothetical protein